MLLPAAPAAPVPPVAPVVAELPQGQPQLPVQQQQQPVPQQDWAQEQEWSREQEWSQEHELAAQDIQGSPWFAAQQAPEGAYESAYNPTYVEGLEPTPVAAPQPQIPEANGRRPLRVPGQRSEEQYEQPAVAEQQEPDELPAPSLPDDLSRDEAYYTAFNKYVSEHGEFPNARQYGKYLLELYGFKGRSGGPLSESTLRGPLKEYRDRYQAQFNAGADESEYIA